MPHEFALNDVECKQILVVVPDVVTVVVSSLISVVVASIIPVLKIGGIATVVDIVVVFGANGSSPPKISFPTVALVTVFVFVIVVIEAGSAP